MTPDDAIESGRYDAWLCCKSCGEYFPQHDGAICRNPDSQEQGKSKTATFAQMNERIASLIFSPVYQSFPPP